MDFDVATFVFGIMTGVVATFIAVSVVIGAVYRVQERKKK